MDLLALQAKMRDVQSRIERATFSAGFDGQELQRLLIEKLELSRAISKATAN